MNNTGQVARNNDWVNAAERSSGPRHDLRPSCQAPPMGVPWHACNCSQADSSH